MEGCGFLRSGLPVHFPFRRIHYFFPVALILMTSVLIAFKADHHSYYGEL